MGLPEAERMSIRRRIVKEYAAGNYIRSIMKPTMETLIRDFHDEHKEAARQEVLQMVQEHILIPSATEPIQYSLNLTNKYIEIQNIRNSNLEVMQPHENLIPEEFPKKPTFVTEGSKDSKGVIGKYFYYNNEADGAWIVFIVTSLVGRPEKKELGSLNELSSVLSQVWIAIDKKLKKNKFHKAELDTLIGNHRIVQNRQPIKAAMDVLEYLGYVRKTGVKKGRSDEYEKTGRKPPEPGLDGWFSGSKPDDTHGESKE
jgi:hypothetical protein